MGIGRWAIASLITGHVLAIFLAALPPSELFNEAHAKLSPDTVPADRSVTGRFVDEAVRITLPATRQLARLGDWARPFVVPYQRLTGTYQIWVMFSEPTRSDRYLKTRYYIRPVAGGRNWTATELVWPGHREDEVRFFQGFRDSFLDKALDNSMELFYEHRDKALIRPDTRPEQLPDDYAPAARYYARRYARDARLHERGEKIVRIEVWLGNARNHELGHAIDANKRADRQDLLSQYYGGAVEQRISVPPYPPYHAGYREADIEWVLEYFEEPGA
jgi:hypothetical protein